MNKMRSKPSYFPHVIQISAKAWNELDLGNISDRVTRHNLPAIIFYRQLAFNLNKRAVPGTPPVHAGQLNLYATLQNVYRHIIDVLAEDDTPSLLQNAINKSAAANIPDTAVTVILEQFVRHFPPADILQGKTEIKTWLADLKHPSVRRRMVFTELLLLRLAAENSAINNFRSILDDRELAAAESGYLRLVSGLEKSLEDGPVLAKLDMTLIEALRAPLAASPGSLSGQLDFIRKQWQELLPPSIQEELVSAFDILREEERQRGWGGEPGPPSVLEFGVGRPGHGAGGDFGDGSSVFGGYDYPEYEQFSADSDWMSNVVLLAKMVYVWLGQLSIQYGYPVTRLDQIPDTELERLSKAGFTGLWLIGIWERSAASKRIKQLCGNPDAIASAYSLYDYEIAADLGGWEALANLRERALRRGIRLASDMVPNHTGIYSRWVMQHPDWFVQTDYPPFPGYQFTGENLSHSGDAVIQIEDGYWTKSDAAVVFRYIERSTGRTRYIYHGNDGTSIPWNDTAQLNYLLPEVREAVIQTILHVARNFPIIRFDAAMTLAKKHYQRLWFPVRGLGGGIPSRAEHGMTREEFDALFPVEFWREVVDRVSAEAPDTLLLAEAFWMMEGYFVRTLGMHRVYNSAFMNMLKTEENAKYRKTISNVLEFNPEVLKRFVNFMNNPDEKTAVEQFGTQGKYFGACLLMVTMPGLPMFGHGQIEGFHEKYGMEYKRAYWDETPDSGLIRGHEMWIFPLLRLRWLFSGSENFALYDFHAGDQINENVFAYSNSVGERRALVLYHNNHAKTSGWIKDSVPYTAKAANDEQQLRRTSLSAALGLTAQVSVFCAFRDVTSNLEFLRESSELCSKGLYAELGEYEFHVFLNFREINDDRDRTWSNLCRSLQGAGVDNLDDERKQLQYAQLNIDFKNVLAALPDPALPEPGAITDEKYFTEAVTIFEKRLLTQTTRISKIKLKPDLFLEAVACLKNVSVKKTTAKNTSFKKVMYEAVNAPFAGELLAAWMLLKDFPTTTLEKYGFDCTLKRLVNTKHPDSRFPLALLKALLAFSDTTVSGPVKGAAIATKAFSLQSCRSYMDVHISENVEWFNKERYEELMLWLLIAALPYDSDELLVPRKLTARLTAMYKIFSSLTENAAAAGYRTKLLLDLLKDEKRAATPSKPVTAVRQPQNKGKG
ncbi:MAG: alpha-amylase [Geobacteraceae bacterium GWC2_48_7]|nr:MAG: alpha-amylase [Geobacteraceae bacterium GWC2_48_7]